MRTTIAHLLRRVADELAPPEPSIQEQILANQRKLLALSQSGPQIVEAVTAAVNGGIGGRVGLGFRQPPDDGTARY
jgi:hypothetical protein